MANESKYLHLATLAALAAAAAVQRKKHAESLGQILPHSPRGIRISA